jgi:hypothetical protein
MKNTLFLFLAALLISAGLNAQTTVDSIRSKYKLLPMPQAMNTEQAFPAVGNYQFAAADGQAAQVAITLDSVNRGIVWVEGLPVGRFKAFLKQSPSSYRVVAQKTASGQQIPEGTLFFDQSTNTLHVALGKAFNEANPTEIFALATATAATDETQLAAPTEAKVKVKTSAGKSKSKVVFYTATKASQETTAGTSATGTTNQQ